ncbi:MAG: hypothetical protein P8M18_01235 [Woeseiaceae bacterium]|nr:hypothetical protein [Woeseiaceae bacterium]
MRKLIHSLALIILPIIVAWHGLSVTGAVALVALLLLWRWAISVSMVLSPPKVPELELETIAASHYAEKARWCMDRLGLEYQENTVAGIFGVLFTGRSVPKLTFRTGLVRSTIGNSPEILRYLWGRYGNELGDTAAFLEPTAERVELERLLDRYGACLQAWVYYHILDHRDVTMKAWGVSSPEVPAWQRALMPVLYPLFAAFLRKALQISDENYEEMVEKIETVLADVEFRLDDGRRSILGGDDTDYVDMTFASLTALWVQPEQFAAGRVPSARIDWANYPIQMGVDVERWNHQYPLAVALVERLYREERVSG